MSKIVSVDPFRCRMWDLHDRFLDTITEQTCRTEIESFSCHGQVVPALGRPVQDNPDYDIELICGARRLFVARHIGQNLTVELREMSDREALIAMDAENRQRIDLSPYERGRSYSRLLRNGYFESQDELARTLKISPSQVSRLLKLARLPAVIVNAFRKPSEIHESWGDQLLRLLDDPERRELVIQIARSIPSKERRPEGKEVYQRLLGAAARAGRPRRTTQHDEVVKNDHGQPLFRIRRLRNYVALLLPLESVPENRLSVVQSAMMKVLQPSLCSAPASWKYDRDGSEPSAAAGEGLHRS